jgi:hypothetical protein
MEWAAVLQPSILVAVGAATTIGTTLLAGSATRKKEQAGWAREDRLQVEERERADENDRHRSGQARAESILAACDEILSHFDAQRGDVDRSPERAYVLPYDTVNRVRHDARLIPVPALREIILTGMVAVSGPWVPASAVELDAVNEQRRIVSGVTRAVTAFLNREPLDSSVLDRFEATMAIQRAEADYYYSQERW